MNRIGLCLDPLDVLFFRDGRSFDAASKVVSGLPSPQVLAGAVRTALLEKYGCNFAKLQPEMKRRGKFRPAVAAAFPEHAWIGEIGFRGPWLCRLPDEQTGLDVFLPAPATVHTRKKGERVPGGPNVFRLQPLKEGELPGWSDKTMRPLWLNNTIPTEPASGFINLKGLAQFLEGDDPDEVTLFSAGKFYDHDTRTGIGIDGGKLAAAEGEIYGIRFLSLKRGVGFYAEIDMPDGKGKEVFDGVRFLAFGGEGKRVAVRTVPKFPFPEPPTCDPAKGQKRFVLLTTPAVTSADGKPYYPKDCAAAAVNSPVAISGWDIAKGGPKPTRFAAPAGSVYFFNSTADVPEPNDEFGYGRHLQGVWTDG